MNLTITDALTFISLVITSGFAAATLLWAIFNNVLSKKANRKELEDYQKSHEKEHKLEEKALLEQIKSQTQIIEELRTIVENLESTIIKSIESYDRKLEKHEERYKHIRA